jgi:hypothetical protein
MYRCAQNSSRQLKPTKISNPAVKNRDKEQMDTFQCHGWLFITIMDGGADAFIKFRHNEDHIPYWNIDVPQDVKDYVLKNIDLSPTQVCFNFSLAFCFFIDWKNLAMGQYS